MIPFELCGNDGCDQIGKLQSNIICFRYRKKWRSDNGVVAQPGLAAREEVRDSKTVSLVCAVATIIENELCQAARKMVPHEIIDSFEEITVSVIKALFIRGDECLKLRAKADNTKDRQATMPTFQQEFFGEVLFVRESELIILESRFAQESFPFDFRVRSETKIVVGSSDVMNVPVQRTKSIFRNRNSSQYTEGVFSPSMHSE